MLYISLPDTFYNPYFNTRIYIQIMTDFKKEKLTFAEEIKVPNVYDGKTEKPRAKSIMSNDEMRDAIAKVLYMKGKSSSEVGRVFEKVDAFIDDLKDAKFKEGTPVDKSLLLGLVLITIGMKERYPDIEQAMAHVKKLAHNMPKEDKGRLSTEDFEGLVDATIELMALLWHLF